MPVKTVAPALKRMLEEKERLEAEFMRALDRSEALRNKLEGIELAISIMEGDHETPRALTQPTGSVKALLLDFAREVGAAGLNANIAVQMAQKQGITLLRGTAASNLSRLKADEALVHDGERYRLPEFTRSQLQLAVHPGGKGS